MVLLFTSNDDFSSLEDHTFIAHNWKGHSIFNALMASITKDTAGSTELILNWSHNGILLDLGCVIQVFFPTNYSHIIAYTRKSVVWNNWMERWRKIVEGKSGWSKVFRKLFTWKIVVICSCLSGNRLEENDVMYMWVEKVWWPERCEDDQSLILMIRCH